MTQPELLAGLGAGSWVLLVVGATLIGFSKTAISGMSMISVAIFAALLPSRLSTGVVLVLLLVGDVVAVRSYHQHADWRALVRLVPAVVVGVIAGVVFIANVDDEFMRRAIGVVLVLLVGLHVAMRRRRPQPANATTTSTGATGGAVGDGPAHTPHRLAAWGFGSLSGFTTMVANAGGPAMSLYLLNARYSVLGFLGTTSWFFFVINMVKVPFSVGLHLITPATLHLDLLLAPAVLVGTWLGRVVITRVPQQVFETLVLVTATLSGLNLLR